jgi:VIT1/CCC1 family predicted Fe2+/Mn2+ transporter
MFHDHSAEAIRDRLVEGPSANYIRDWVYGGIDGAVTTFAIVAGVVGADFSTRVLMILGVANLVADGFSMAASNYSGTKTEQEEFERLHAWEDGQITADPKGETAEIREIFRLKGFEGADLERAVEIVTSDRDIWIETMLAEEYGLPRATRAPAISAMSTFAAFILCGVIPLLPFIIGVPAAFETSIVLTAGVFFAIGAVKSRWSMMHWWRSGLEITAIGLGTAFIAYLIGYGLKNLI